MDPQLFDKIEAVPGDITEENFGIAEESMKNLIDNVQIIFHSAATVR